MKILPGEGKNFGRISGQDTNKKHELKVKTGEKHGARGGWGVVSKKKGQKNHKAELQRRIKWPDWTLAKKKKVPVCGAKRAEQAGKNHPSWGALTGAKKGTLQLSGAYVDEKVGWGKTFGQVMCEICGKVPDGGCQDTAWLPFGGKQGLGIGKWGNKHLKREEKASHKHKRRAWRSVR